MWKEYQLLKSFSNKKHPFHKFSTGNIDTLKNIPLEKSKIFLY
jgi:insulysin